MPSATWVAWEINLQTLVCKQTHTTTTTLLKDYAGIAVLEPSGDLGRSEIASLGRIISSLVASESVRIVLSLKEVTHLHYAAIVKLVESLLFLKMVNGDLKLAHLNGYHRKLFQFAGIEEHFESYESLEDAVLSFVGPLM